MREGVRNSLWEDANYKIWFAEASYVVEKQENHMLYIFIPQTNISICKGKTTSITLGRLR